MNPPITKFDVFLYFANQLNRARRLELEAACKTNAQVRQWFAELTPTDEELEHEALLEVASDPAEYCRRDARTDPSTQPEESRLWALAHFQRLPESERQASPLLAAVRQLDTRRYGGFVRQWEFSLAMAAAGCKPTAYPLDPQTRDYLAQDGDQIFLDCPEHCIPHGLGWLILTEPNGVVTLRLPELDFDRQTRRWSLTTTVEELLGGRRPEGEQLQSHFLPATKQTREAFDGAEVRQFVQSLPKQSVQRKRAEAFLATREK
jgi:hypothetical protein